MYDNAIFNPGLKFFRFFPFSRLLQCTNQSELDYPLQQCTILGNWIFHYNKAPIFLTQLYFLLQQGTISKSNLSQLLQQCTNYFFEKISFLPCYTTRRYGSPSGLPLCVFSQKNDFFLFRFLHWPIFSQFLIRLNLLITTFALFLTDFPGFGTKMFYTKTWN